MSNPRNGPELAKTASVDDRHVSAPWSSINVEIAWELKTVSNNPRNRPESAKTVTVDDRHINAPQGSLIMEITMGPQKSE